jgi:hypothetical protein
MMKSHGFSIMTQKEMLKHPKEKSTSSILPSVLKVYSSTIAEKFQIPDQAS